MKRRSRSETSRTISRILAFIFSAAIAYCLWTYLRPRFVPSESIQPNNQTHEAQPIALTPQEVLSQDSAPQTPKTAIPATSKAEDTMPVVITQTPVSVAQATNAPDRADSTSTIQQPVLKKPATEPINKHQEAKTAQKTVKALPANRTITVHNGIEKKMLGYKKFGTHYPTNFKVTIGKAIIQQGADVTAAVKDNTLMVRYDFEFMNGYRRGGREVTVGLKPDTDTITLAFNWKQKYHLVIAEADKVTSTIEKDVPYQA